MATRQTFFAKLGPLLALLLLNGMVQVGGLKRGLAARAVSRRGLLSTAAAVVVGVPARRALARDETFERLGTEAPVTKDGDTPFTTLVGGVKIKVMRIGPGVGEAIEKGRFVVVELNALALNLNGKPFFSTKLKDGTPDPLSWTIGEGRAVPGLEEGMIGMKKGEVRRIIVPAAQGYAVVHAGEPYLPQPRDDLDRNALNSILKNPNRDATILFDVRVNRIR